MKKFVTGLCAALLLFTMSGCSDATTNVSNKNEALITIGNEKITNGDVYSGLIAQGDVSAVASALSKAIASKAVETTEDIEKSAQASLDALKANNKDWDAYLAKNNYKKEKELFADLIVQVKESKITTQYVSDEYLNLVPRLEPRKLQIVSITNADHVKEAVKKAKDGAEFADLARQYGNSKYVGNTQIYTNQSGLAESVWEVVKETEEGKVCKEAAYDATSGTYYLIKVIDSKTNEFKEEAIPVIAALSTTNAEGLKISEEAFKYYLNKFNYSIHDATVYGALLNQSVKYERVR